MILIVHVDYNFVVAVDVVLRIRGRIDSKAGTDPVQSPRRF
jgi:hypothetical protein